MDKLSKYALLSVLALLALGLSSKAQFREEAFTQTYVDEADTTGRDSTDVMFSFKEYFGGIKHTKEARIGVMMAGSTVMVGGMQMYNKQYWKLPVIYGGIGAGIGAGIIFRQKWHKDGDADFKKLSNWFFAGAGLIYWGALLDGTINYNKEVHNQAGKATLYSLLLPGLGQAYNGEYWKIPIYYGCIIGAMHFYSTNRKSYLKYKRIYDQAANPDIPYDGPVSASTAKYYRDSYRRYRDYSMLAIAGFYLLQVIDANVFSYMRDFDLSDDIAMNVSPSVITDTPAYAFNNPYSQEFSNSNRNVYGSGQNGVGLRIGFKF